MARYGSIDGPGGWPSIILVGAALSTILEAGGVSDQPGALGAVAAAAAVYSLLPTPTQEFASGGLAVAATLGGLSVFFGGTESCPAAWSSAGPPTRAFFGVALSILVIPWIVRLFPGLAPRRSRRIGHGQWLLLLFGLIELGLFVTVPGGVFGIESAPLGLVVALLVLLAAVAALASFVPVLTLSLVAMSVAIATFYLAGYDRVSLGGTGNRCGDPAGGAVAFILCVIVGWTVAALRPGRDPRSGA